MSRNVARIQSGSAIVEVIDDSESDAILLTISKERYDEDHVQIRLPRHVAAAVGSMLRGESE